MTYSLAEATLLKNYYQEKMIGQILDIELGILIKEIKIDQQEDTSKYLMRACGQRGGRRTLLFLEISEMAKRLNLISPALVLQGLNHNQ